MENENENLDSLNETEADTETSDASQVDVNALIEQNKKLYARAKAAEAKLKQPQPKPDITKKEEPNVLTEDKVWEVADLIRQGYTRKDAEFLMKNGGTKALEDPNSYVSIAMKNIMEQRKAEQMAAQTASGGGEESSSIIPEDKLKSMSADEMEKILPHA